MKKLVLSWSAILGLSFFVQAQEAKNHHQVSAGETLYALSKKYKVSIEDLIRWNPQLKNSSNLSVGELLIVSENKKKPQHKLTVSKTDKKTTPETFSLQRAVKIIEIQKGQTIYELAVTNHTTISEIIELNPNLEINKLSAGQRIRIPLTSSENKTKQLTPNIQKNTFEKTTEVKTHLVASSETIYGISKRYQLTTEDLMHLNPELKDGLKSGMLLKVENEISTIDKSNFDDGFSTKDRTYTKENRELVLLLPFNLDKIPLDNVQLLHRKLNTDVFLNMTLDFYSGALLALKKAKEENLPLQVTILDSQENSQQLNIQSIKNQKDFTDTDVIIGPFFQKNVDAVSKEFLNTKTVVVSPISTDKGMPYDNQIHSMPNSDYLKQAVFSFLNQQNENTIVICDTRAKMFSWKKKYPEYHWIQSNKFDVVDENHWISKLRKNQKNFLVVQTSSLKILIPLINKLKSLSSDYEIQLVALDKNDAFDSSEINIQDLANLKLLYPSVTNDSTNIRAEKFNKIYKETYGQIPNRFAVRGYDVTLDVISRMFFSDSRTRNILEKKTQQIENKFAFEFKNGGVYNNAVYLLQYNKNLEINLIN